MFDLRARKAFTIIELIIVIVIIGVLVLFASPKVINYVNQAKLIRIQHDTRIMEDVMEEEFQNGITQQWKDWSVNNKNLFNIVLRKQLFEAEGVAKRIDMSYMKYQPFIAANPNVNPQIIMATIEGKLNDEGLLMNTAIGGSEVKTGQDLIQDIPHTDYRIIPNKFKSLIGTRLKGTFYVNALGKVYYEPDKPLTLKGENEKTQLPNCPVALPDYEFEHTTGTIVKYHGNAQHLIIPSAFLVEGKCWPVRIIGKAAFMQGGYKSIIIPSTVEKIEEDAFKDNNLTEIIIPPIVMEIGPNAFENNNLGQDSVIIQQPEDGWYKDSEIVKPDEYPIIIIGPGVFSNQGASSGSVNPIYRPPTNKDLGVVVKPKHDSSGKITGGIIISGGIGSLSSTRPGGSSKPSGSNSNGAGNAGDIINNISGNNGGSGDILVIPPTVVIDGEEVPITEIKAGAYQGLGLITVVLPEGLERIEDYAFAGNQLIGITIPNSVSYIGNYAFAFNEIHKIGNMPGPDSIATIKTIILKDTEQFNKVNKYGDIYEAGAKLDIMKTSDKGPDIILKNHIWVTSIGNIVINEEYIEGMEPGDKTILLNKLEEIYKLNKNDYETGWHDLETAINEANKIVQKPKLTETEIAIMIAKLDKAVNNLVKKIITPGPSKPIEGATDGEYTFYGEVATSELITGDDLAKFIKLSRGTAYNSTTPWLKFTKKTEDGAITTIYVAKRPFRYDLLWSDINKVDAVYGNKTIVINDKIYKIRLMQGANKDPISNKESRDFHNSEWNRLILPIHERAINKAWAYKQNIGPNDVSEFTHNLGSGNQRRYSDYDLLTRTQFGNGASSWTQEGVRGYGSYVVRGGYDASDGDNLSSSSVGRYYGWRPVLELLQD